MPNARRKERAREPLGGKYLNIHPTAASEMIFAAERLE